MLNKEGKETQHKMLKSKGGSSTMSFLGTNSVHQSFLQESVGNAASSNPYAPNTQKGSKNLDKKKTAVRKSKNDSFVGSRPSIKKTSPKEYKPGDFAGNVRIVGENREGQSSSPMSAQQPLLL